ncbi:MAG: hypothetical protein ACR2OC_10825, partial [Solirubrobacterales bacterium]
MALSLIIGPPNSGRAGVVRRELADSLASEPMLVVPTVDDVSRFERELCDFPDAVLGASVRTFEALFGDVAAAVGAVLPEPLSASQRRRAVILGARASGDARISALADRPGFARALARSIEELQAGRIAPDALDRVAADGADGEHLRGLAAAFRGYLELRDRLRRGDRHLTAERAISGLRATPDAWGARPVFLYGFDDLSEEQLALVEALTAATEVTVAVTFENEREPLAARATLVGQLSELADRPERELPPNAEHTASPVLFAIERGLFEDAPQRAAPDGGLVFIQSVGERAEAESIGAEVAALIAAGAQPDSIAIALRSVERLGPLYESVLTRLGLPVAVHAGIPLGATGAGAGILALLRAADGGHAEDVVAYLRAPGRAFADQVDWLERSIRRDRLREVDEALAEWDGRELSELAALRNPASPAAACLEVADVARRMSAGAERRSAPLMDHAEALEARAAELVRRTAEELAAIGEL